MQRSKERNEHESFCHESYRSSGLHGETHSPSRSKRCDRQNDQSLICTSDSHTVGGAVGPRENLTLGHEAVGIVHEVGSNVKLFKPGDRVLVGAITPDWFDPASQAGHSSQSGSPLGGWKFSNTKDGVFAEYFHVNDADGNMARIPDSVPDEVAVYCADMLSTGDRKSVV